MSHVYTGIPAKLTTGIARNAVAAEDRDINRFQLSAWFPNFFLDSTDYKYMTGTDRTYSESAQFRAWDTPPMLGKRPGYKKIQGELPVLTIEYLITEFDQIQLQAAQRDQEASALLLPVVSQDVIRGVQAIERRFEFMRRDLVLTGKARLDENGVDLEVDTGRDPLRNQTVLVGWDDSVNAQTVNDERGVVDQMLDAENLQASDFIAMMNTVTWRAWKQAQQTRDLWPTLRVVPTGGITDGDANQIRRDQELPTVQINDSRGMNPLTGVVEKLIPDYQVVYLPSTVPVGQTMYGVTPMSNDPDVEIPLSQRPGPLAYIHRETRPSNYSTVIEALGAPVLKDPDAIFVLDVQP